MQKTPLYDKHVALGAKMVPFADFAMPVEYSGIQQEHMAVREAAGIFDVSHMGEFWVKGPRALALLQKVCSTDVAGLPIGKAQYCYFPNGRGGVVDDLLVYAYEAQKYLLVVNAGNIQKDWDWLQTNNTMGAELENASKHMALLAIQGPRAQSILQALTSVNLNDLPAFSFTTGRVGAWEQVIVSHTGYTGAGGYELYVAAEQAPGLWDLLLQEGAEKGLIPCGLGARDTLRLEMGFCLYGKDIDEQTSPISAGLGWVTHLTDGREFIDREILERQMKEGVAERLKGIVLLERGIPRSGYLLVNEAGEEVGRVTSGSQSPVLKQGIGLAYVTKPYWKPGSRLFVRIRNKDIAAEIRKPPFIEGF